MPLEPDDEIIDPELEADLAAAVAHLETFCEVEGNGSEGILGWSAVPVDTAHGSRSAILSVWPRHPERFQHFDVHAFNRETDAGILQFSPGHEAIGLLSERLGTSDDPHLWIMAYFPVPEPDGEQAEDAWIGDLVRRLQVYFYFREPTPRAGLFAEASVSSLPKDGVPLLWNGQEIGEVNAIDWHDFPSFTGHVRLQAMPEGMTETLDWFARGFEPEDGAHAEQYCANWELRLREGRYAPIDLPIIRRLDGVITAAIESIERRKTPIVGQ